MTNLYECNFCKAMLPARDLYPVKEVDRDLKIHHFLLCRDCATDANNEKPGFNQFDYVDEFETESVSDYVERMR